MLYILGNQVYVRQSRQFFLKPYVRELNCSRRDLFENQGTTVYIHTDILVRCETSVIAMLMGVVYYFMRSRCAETMIY